MDYRRFLAPVAAPLVGLYLGGTDVWISERRLRLTRRPDGPGWYSFRVRGRQATPLGPAEAQPLERLPVVRGHYWSAHLVCEDARAYLLELPIPDEPLQLSPYRARRWLEGQLLAEGEDFAGEVEEFARAALEEARGLGAQRGIPASLRAAFVYATCEQVGVGLGVSWQPLELRAHLLELARGGPEAVRALLARFAERRAAAEARARPQVAPSEPARRASGEEGARAAEVLAATGARFRSARRLAGGLLEVRYAFLGGRFVTTLVEDTLQVVDAGICLDGADSALTLESLPGAIREAEQRGVLVVTRS